MEDTHPLAIESFSHSWLLNARRPSLDGLADSESIHHHDDITFSVHSMRFMEAKSFKFDITADYSECALVHADEIFWDGHMMPLYLDRPKPEEAFNTSSSAPATPANLSLPVVRGNKDHHQDYIIQKWKKLRSRILHKWFGFLRRLGSSRNSAKVSDLRKTKSCSNTPQESPLHSPTHLWGHMAETSITEAIIHCKKSFGMLDAT